MIPDLPQIFLRAPLAHRALHDVAAGRPENSRAAIRAAIQAGYGIEIDVQLSGDNRAMVFHDDTLDRLTQHKGPLRAHSAAALAQIPLRGGDGEGIYPLETVLEQVAGQVPLLIEIKDQDGAMGPNVGPLEQAVATAISNYDGPLALMSFNPHAVRVLARLCPNVPRGLVTSAYRPGEWSLPTDLCDTLRDIPDFDSCAAAFISHEVDDLTRPRVAQLKARGAAILCWTVTSAAQEEQARKIADNITFEQYNAAIPLE